MPDTFDDAAADTQAADTQVADTALLEHEPPGDRPPVDDVVGTPWYGNDAILYRIVATLTVAPILIAAVRAGLAGWVPTFDSANFVMWSRFSLGADPHLVGIYTDASRWARDATYFPGPWWLWWMAIPIRVFGPTWGPLLSISILQSAWILLAGWCVKRRLGPRVGIAVLLFLAALSWTLGNAAYHSPVGQIMIVPTFAAFLFIAWALAAGDEGVLPAFALITNFIVLDEVVLVRLVPTIAAGALAIWAAGALRLDRRNPATRDERRRRTLRAVLGAGAISIVLWIPAIVQQLTHDPGNLTNLWRAAQANPAETTIWGRSHEVLLSLFTDPPFWLHGSRTGNHLIYSPPPPLVVNAGVSILLVVTGIVLGVRAFRRRDRAGVTVLVFAAVVWVAAWYNLALPPDPTGMPTYVGYYLSTWAVAMFVTFAYAFNSWRQVPALGTQARRVVALGLAITLAVVDIPHANHPDGTYESSDQMVSTARAINNEVLEAVQGHGRVALPPADVHATPYVLAVAVAFERAGIPFCLSGVPEWVPLPIRECTDYPADVTLTINRSAKAPAPAPGAEVVARHDALSAAEQHELTLLTDKVTDAVDAATSLEVTGQFRDLVNSTIPAGPLRTAALEPSVLDTSGGPMATDASRAEFAGWLGVASGTFGDDRRSPLHLDEISDEDLLRWAELEAASSYRSFVVTLTPNR